MICNMSNAARRLSVKTDEFAQKESGKIDFDERKQVNVL